MVRQLARLVMVWGPWVAVAILLWREQSLEEAVADFVAKANAEIVAGSQMPEDGPMMGEPDV